jgi:hypothetical protein
MQAKPAVNRLKMEKSDMLVVEVVQIGILVKDQVGFAWKKRLCQRVAGVKKNG